jgi:MYXO-CTERM domain-containing protein
MPRLPNRRPCSCVVWFAAVLAALLLGLAPPAAAQTATTAGAVTTPYPTTQGISVEWAITGDSNNNGAVAVRYRKQGDSAWQVGMPLLRVPAGSNTTGDFGSGGGAWASHHAGSLFDLEPGTTYDIELTLTDLDGGSTTATTTAATRPIPVAAADAATKQVTTSTFSSAIAAAAPGDILLLAAGSYPSFTMSRDGSAGKPIVIRGSSVDGVTFGGRVTLSDRQWVHLENVTVNGEVRADGVSNAAIRGCKIRSTSNGIRIEIGKAVPRNNYIVDNDIVGGATWTNEQLGADGYDGGEGIQITGSGHVVCWNHVKGFRDNISFMEYDEAYEQVSIDICNNDIEEATDDAIEADSAMGNVRVLRNRITNCFVGISAQPDLGGPTYYVRNVMYNVVYSPFKFHNGTVGDVVLHNTVVKCGDGWGCYAGETWSRAFVRNNLFIGGTGGGTYGGYGNGTGRVLDLGDADATCSFDYDGLGSIGTGKFEGKIGSTRFSSVATMQSSTTEAHGIQVDMSIFAGPVTFPSSPFPPGPAPDLRLAGGSAAVDKGLAIAGINDGFAGTGPDLGAYEAGDVLPVYGPRVPGSGGAGGSTGSGGAVGSGGNTAGPADGAAGATGAGGTTSGPAGGSIGSGGTRRTGGADGGPGGRVSGSGGAVGVGGAPGSGGLGTGGVVGVDGAVGEGGAVGPGAGGITGEPDAPAVAGASGSGKSGCSCRLGGPAKPQRLWLLVGLALAWRRRRRTKPRAPGRFG